MTALVIEDEMIEIRALVKMFSICFPKKFERILTAINGRTALALLESNKIDLVILDINLPDMQGTDILRIITETYPETKVIMATAYSGNEYVRTSMKYKAFDYLLKPYSMETFREAVSSFIQSVEGDSYGQIGISARVRNYVSENYATDFGLDDIADALGFDKSYLGRVFKNTEGKSIMLYVQEYRMDKAEVLMKKGMSVSETCFSVGFKDPAYFSKCYKKVKGRTPSSTKDSN